MIKGKLVCFVLRQTLVSPITWIRIKGETQAHLRLRRVPHNRRHTQVTYHSQISKKTWMRHPSAIKVHRIQFVSRCRIQCISRCQLQCISRCQIQCTSWDRRLRIDWITKWQCSQGTNPALWSSWYHEDELCSATRLYKVIINFSERKKPE